jgi:GTPase
MEPSS